MRKVLFSLLFFSTIFSQAKIGEWDSYTSTLNINQIIQYENILIGATDGGLLLYDLNTKKFDELNNIDGLFSTRLNCLALGASGTIWIGGGEPNGFVQIYDVINQESISEFNYEMTEIIDFAVSDSIVYAVYRDNNDYGLIEFNYINNKFIHKDLYPNWPKGNKINQIEIIGEQVFVGTEAGLYVGKLGNDPNNWMKLSNELDSNVSSLLVFNNYLYFNSIDQIYKVDPNNLSYSIIDQYSGQNLKEFIVYGDDDIIYLSNSIIQNISDSTIHSILIQKNSVNSVSRYDENNIVFATTTGLAFLGTGNTLDYIVPNTPNENNFQAIAVLNDGRFVVGGNQGISIKELDGWRNIVKSNDEVVIQNNKDYSYFIADSIPVDFGVSISKMVQGPDEQLYCAIEGTYPKRNGGGVLIIDVDDPEKFTIIDTTFLDYFADEYLIVKDVDFDRDGNLWVADAYATTKHEPLHVKSLDGNWLAYNADNSNRAVGLTPGTIAIDAWQRIWLGSFQDSERNSGFPNGGISMLSYSGNPLKPDSYQWYRINLNYTDINQTIWSLAISPENRLYILTPVGLTFVDLQYADNDPIKYESPRYYFPNISFGQESEVRLDAHGNAWTVSGSDGIHVLLNNSTYWPDENENLEVESINTENYPLLSDNVTDIAFNDESGIAYISTINGINSFRIPFAESKMNYSRIRAFPSPFHVPSEIPLIIDNLKDNSSLKVMTINGRVIRSLEDSDLGIHGYQIKWDGRDEKGKWVNSGVYLLSVYTEDGSNSYTKIAVIRH